MPDMIGIAGSMQRIGTTTQAIQLTRFLITAGYTTVYVEMNRQDYIWGCSTLYGGTDRRKPVDSFAYDEIKMYKKPRLEELLKSDAYDYLICDFGNLRAAGFDKASFAECDARIIMCGTKPNEIYQTEMIMSDAGLADNIFVFSFVPKEDEFEIREMMGDKGSSILFTPALFDPFGNYRKHYGKGGYFYKLMDLVIASKGGGQ